MLKKKRFHSLNSVNFFLNVVHLQVQRVTASGIRIFTPEIPGIGKIRIRYPIATIHQEGSTAWKNMIAMQDVLMDMKRFYRIFERKPEIKDLDIHEDAHYKTSTTHANPPGMHAHDIYLTAEEMEALSHNGTVSVYTTENNGHQHEMELKKNPTSQGLQNLIVVSCDGLPRCWDHHQPRVYKQRF